MQTLIAWIRALFFGPALPKVGARTIVDPLAFIVQARPDGSLATVHDVLTERRRDWPLPLGWEASDSVLMDDGAALQTFSFAPFGPFNLANGDGGQILKVGRDGFVRATQTRDGGKPYMQYFVGEGSGGTGWIFFGIDAPTGKWRELIATLSGERWAGARPILSRAFTRYRLELIRFDFHPAGVRWLNTIVSEHYDGEAIAGSSAMERSYFARGFGLVRWEAWGRTEAAPVSDLAERYQHVAFSDPPATGWFLDDVRTYTNVVPCEPTAVPVMS